MKGLLGLILKSVGIKKLLGIVWDMAHDQLEKHVAKTSNEYDDKALAVVDQFIKEFIAE